MAAVAAVALCAAYQEVVQTQVLDPADATLDNIEAVGEWIDQYKEVSDSTFREAYTSSPNILHFQPQHIPIVWGSEVQQEEVREESS